MHKMSRSKQTQESPIEILQDNSIEAVEESKAMECIETDEIPEVEPQKQSNGKMISCNAITLPREFMATSWVQRENEARGVSPILLADEEDCQETGRIISEKPASSMCQHLKPLYIKPHMDGRPVNRVLVDNGAAMNILPTSMHRKLFKT